MTGKKVSIGTRPTTAKPASADDWVETRTASTEPEKMKRLTIDVPESLHRAIKMQCTMNGTSIADEVRELLTEKYVKK
jgi:ParG